MRWVVALCWVMVCALAASGQAGQDADDRKVTPPRGPLELVDDGPAPNPRPGLRTKAAVALRDGFVSVQVNIDGDGLNIVGDAANEPSLAVDPTAGNRLVMGWRQFDTVQSNFRKAGWAWSSDGGRTWTAPGTLERIFRSDPVLITDGVGRVYYYSLRVDNGTGNILCDAFLSDDGGRTWSGRIPAFGGDKAWIALDHGDGVGHGSFYASWSPSGGCCGRRVFTRSTDGGVTYLEPVELDPAPSWGSMAVGPEGEVYLAGNAALDLEHFVLARSLDARDASVAAPAFDYFEIDLGGAQIAFDETGPNPGGLIGQVWLAVDTSGGAHHGDLYAACSVDPPGADRCDLHLVRSSDGGETWTEPVVVAADDRGLWQWFGTMAVAPSGRIDLVWVESLGPAEPNQGELRYASSGDGGATFSDPVSLSPAFDSHLGWPRQEKLGDYYQLIADDVGAHLAWAATFNGEQDVYYMRIGEMDCNANALGDLEDIATGASLDCNGNDIPDECEVAAGSLGDADGDGVPNECEPSYVMPRRPSGRLP